jgi:two-component sensor histidine kinase
LSNGIGHVELTWRQVTNGEQPKVTITWQESGGPPVTVPQRKGFGSLLIESIGEGESVVDYRPDGVRGLLNLGL